IVFAVAADPVGGGIVASLARSGGNVTGLSSQMADTGGKKLELLRDLVPGLRTLAIMANVGYAASVLETSEVQAAARTLRLDVATLERRILRPPSTQSNAARPPSMSVTIPSWRVMCTASTPLRSSHDCRRCTEFGSDLKAEV